jgi:hypothetical protein
VVLGFRGENEGNQRFTKRQRGGERPCAVHVLARPARLVPEGQDRMNDRVDVTIPVEPEVAKALENPVRREAAGRVLSGLLKGGHLRDTLAEAIVDAKREARAKGLTDEAIDAELRDAIRAGR